MTLSERDAARLAREFATKYGDHSGSYTPARWLVELVQHAHALGAGGMTLSRPSGSGKPVFFLAMPDKDNGFGICEQLAVTSEGDLSGDLITDLTYHTNFEPGMVVLMMDNGTGSNRTVVALFDQGWVLRHTLVPHRNSDNTAREYLDRMIELSR